MQEIEPYLHITMSTLIRSGYIYIYICSEEKVYSVFSICSDIVMFYPNVLIFHIKQMQDLFIRETLFKLRRYGYLM